MSSGRNASKDDSAAPAPSATSAAGRAQQTSVAPLVKSEKTAERQVVAAAVWV